MSLHFADPLILLALLALPLLVWWRRRQGRRMRRITFSLAEETSALGASPRTALARMMPFARYLALVLLIIALARPQRGNALTKVRTDGISIEMLVDISGSMEAMDFTLKGLDTSRLEVVKAVFRDFVLGAENGGGDALAGRPNDPIGIVSFATYPTSACPLTLDHQALVEILDSLEIPLASDRRSTAIGEAIALASLRLKDNEAKSKIMILLTDGESNAGEIVPEQAAKIAKALDIKIYTIGVGSSGKAKVPVRDSKGRIIDYRGLRVRIDEETLKNIAAITGGQYFRASDTRTLRKIYETIDQLEKTETESIRYLEYDELFIFPLLAAMGIFFLESLLGYTWLRVAPIC